MNNDNGANKSRAAAAPASATTAATSVATAAGNHSGGSSGGGCGCVAPSSTATRTNGFEKLSHQGCHNNPLNISKVCVANSAKVGSGQSNKRHSIAAESSVVVAAPAVGGARFSGRGSGGGGGGGFSGAAKTIEESSVQHYAPMQPVSECRKEASRVRI